MSRPSPPPPERETWVPVERAQGLALMRATVRQLRPNQWLKNVFCLAPLVFSKTILDLARAERAFLALASFSLLASAVYIFNDWKDLEKDRQHPKKRKRPMAAGLVPVPLATTLAVALLGGGLALAFILSRPFGFVVTTYLVLNLGYTLRLKNVPLIDIFVIALGFVLRVLGGGFAIRVEVSPWILLCTIFLALFLGANKRRAEIAELGTDGTTRAALAGYNLHFLDHIVTALASLAILSYALYCKDPGTVRRFGPHLVFTIPVVMFGIFRYLLLVWRDGKGSSPTDVVMGDRGLQVCALLWGASVLAVVYLHQVSD